MHSRTLFTSLMGLSLLCVLLNTKLQLGSLSFGDDGRLEDSPVSNHTVSTIFQAQSNDISEKSIPSDVSNHPTLGSQQFDAVNNTTQEERPERGKNETTSKQETPNNTKNSTLLAGNLQHPSLRALPEPHVLHSAKFGLGHRLMRYANGYHLSKALNVSYRVDWKTCKDGTELFPYLFGPEPIRRYPNEGPPQVLVCGNDINGYYSGYVLKQSQTPVVPKVLLEKMQSDQDAYALLRSRFRHRIPLQDENYTRIGIHVRAGNGEQHHFLQAKRTIPVTPEQFCEDLVLRLQEVWKHYQSKFLNKPPMVFLASDTPSWIPLLQTHLEEIGIPVQTLQQERMAEGQGVSYGSDAPNCVDNYKSMVTDMLLLSHSDILIAAMTSTFTASLPMSLVFRQGGLFCETSKDAWAMTCFSNPEAWLLNNCSSDGCKTFGNASRVDFDITTQFPDPLSHNYLELANKFFRDGTKPSMKFGSGINKKYRNVNANITTHQWTFAE